ncbi:MAG: hypothetical protein H6974_08815 [Gammaproteobacteria bacterium]|nr:hypothetical protein [Gammaproteobacteria bacterium]MCP5196870.1 hypothetical protein [Gammaproteobacteria bacterium]
MQFGKSHWRSVAFAVALTLGIGVAGATSVSSQRPRFGLMSASTKSALQLDAQQTAILDRIQAQAAANQQFAGKQLAAIRTLFDQELAQAEPDLRKVVTEARLRFEQLHAQVRDNLDQRLAFYDQLTAEQKQLIRVELQQRLERFDRLRQLALNLLDRAN